MRLLEGLGYEEDILLRTCCSDAGDQRCHFGACGVGGLGFAGMNFDLVRHWSLFVEYKLSYVDLDNLTISGGSIGIAPLMHHLVTGLSFRF